MMEYDYIRLSGYSLWNRYNESDPFNDLKNIVNLYKETYNENPYKLTFEMRAWDCFLLHPGTCILGITNRSSFKRKNGFIESSFKVIRVDVINENYRNSNRVILSNKDESKKVFLYPVAKDEEIQ